MPGVTQFRPTAGKATNGTAPQKRFVPIPATCPPDVALGSLASLVSTRRSVGMSTPRTVAMALVAPFAPFRDAG